MADRLEDTEEADNELEYKKQLKKKSQEFPASETSGDDPEAEEGVDNNVGFKIFYSNDDDQEEIGRSTFKIPVIPAFSFPHVTPAILDPPEKEQSTNSSNANPDIKPEQENVKKGDGPGDLNNSTGKKKKI
ncbi:hypothetical protein HELRODRAFT_177276 [Helobdella robusta]|uniref:Uncharacterized protein n=1 Tax=Helobdella robusta TaxID=6412 RepID=T1FBG0_HELRO|nr:hypothetical protein HELRODRAFT_177276 [Helobdella robusta]ESN98047.1 hypothetical protein HELRODRAFT_177276 [Helobdella robusta]